MKTLSEYLKESLLNEGKNLVKADSKYRKSWNSLFKVFNKEYSLFKKYINDKTVQNAAIRKTDNQEGISELVNYLNSEDGEADIQELVYDNMVMDIEYGEIEADDDFETSGLFWTVLGMGMGDTDGEIIMAFTHYCYNNDLEFSDDATDLCRSLYNAVDNKYHVNESVNESLKDKIRSRLRK